jgi:TPR repeat protein
MNLSAATWVRTAAEHGVPLGQLRWGAMLLEGHGTDKDPAMALHWFILAARAGNAEAMNMAGRCHENGWGVPVDLGRAADWYRRSAQAGHDWGEYNYANALFDGRGAPCDRRQALLYYRRAADRGHSRAMNLLGRCHESGWGCEPNLALAAVWYGRSAAAGYFRGQFNYGCLLLEEGRAAEASHWLALAAQEGDEPMRRRVERLLSFYRSTACASSPTRRGKDHCARLSGQSAPPDFG